MKKSKRLFLLIVSVITSLLIAGCSSSSSSGEAEGKKMNLKMSITVGNTSTWYEAAEKFAEEVKAETDGRITISLFPNEQLSGGDSGKGVELLVKGTTDFSYHSTIIYSILNERLGVVSAPFLFKDLNEVDKKMNGEAGEEIKHVLREIGVEPLGFGQNGFRQLTNSKTEVKAPEDLQGLKVRIPGIKMYTDLWKQFGADPTTMTFSEVFTSLQQGTIDGQENPIDVINSSKLNEVQDHITMWNYSYDPLILGMNKKKFDSLSEEDQAVIKKAAENANAYQIELAREKEEEQIAELKEAGMQFYYPTEEELAKFKQVSQPIYEQYKDVWGADLLDAFQN
ncbi:DctP family TRAP transporter solute-binding subunit [Metabacillus iocasae]|uniref:Tripartite ATP-independent transporter DctP family solute receptor n=1 Tax=Priestia iocasae TaxID=2291674 RepID=A0ABS2QWH8_9BACI|nr:DctP family TRAP transporter solute-binding subunit [Metabacillus iocasae]MBM7703563.1 tripartite ATP-independent transporter DctP family solute receptor [Metabacillus iocasae]